MNKQLKIDIILEFLAKISACYQNFQTNDYTPEVWLEGLSGCRVDDIANSLSYHIKTNVFPPTIADIRQGAEYLAKERSKQIAEAKRLETNNKKLLTYPKEKSLNNKIQIKALLDQSIKDLTKVKINDKIKRAKYEI